MKIASPHCGFAPESNSGGETYEREILKSLARLGVQFEIIMAKGKSYPQGFPEFHVHELPIRKGLRWYVSNWIWPTYLRKVEESCGFDLLRIHSLRYTGPGIHWFNRTAKKKYPVVCHHHHIDASPLNFLIEKKVIEASDCLITGSEFSKRQLIQDLKISEEKIHVVPYGIDQKFVPTAKPSELVRKYKLQDEKVLLFLGGLKKRKKVFFLIDVYEELLKHYSKPIRLIIVGSGALESSLNEYARTKGLAEKIIFTGYVPEEDKILFHNLADVFVFPSELEGFGFSPAEAMACGKPAVISNSGSLPEIVEDGKNGFCVKNEISKFVEKILFFLTHEKEAVLFGKSGAIRAKTVFQWPIAARKTLAIYKDLVDGRTRN